MVCAHEPRRPVRPELVWFHAPTVAVLISSADGGSPAEHHCGTSRQNVTAGCDVRKSGRRRTIATELGLQTPFIFPYRWLNNVTVAGNDIYVNADRANVIYEFRADRGHRHGPPHGRRH